MADAFAYDVLEYPPYIHPQMHPSRLAVIGRIHGIPAASPRQCRLLEVGCGDGLQLLTLAMAYPDSRFVGVDLSQAAIARGEAMRARLGLANLRLVAADLLSWDAGDEPYDYIVAHGFYSWVPESVRKRLMALCKDALAPAGIAYVSYNALPGCHLRRMMWDMLGFHVRGIADPVARTARARDFLAWLGNDLQTGKEYANVVRSEALDLLNATPPAVLFHDDLSPINVPWSVTDFVTEARGHGLEFLGEANYHELSDASAPPEVRERLAALAAGDAVRREQYHDFLKGRRFRQTLLCRRDAGMRPTPDPAALGPLWSAGQVLVKAEDANLADRSPVQFSTPDGAMLTTDLPVAKAALVLIGQAYPHPLAHEALPALAGELAQLDDDGAGEDRDALQQVLLHAFELGLVTLYCDPPRFAAEPGEYPCVSPLARLQLEEGRDLVASLRPSMACLENGVTLELVRLLDGSRNRTALLEDLSDSMARQPIPDDAAGLACHPASWWRQRLAPHLEEGLRQVAKMSLLVPGEADRERSPDVA